MTDATFAEALARLQADLPHIEKGKTAKVTSQRTGKTHSYDYADLADCTRILLPLLARHGFSWTCRPTMIGSDFRLQYVLLHSPSEGTIEGFYPLPSSGSAQEIGSAITYARRYCLCAVTGAAPDDDDDGAAAEHLARATRNQPPETRPDGSATDAELERMRTGREPGATRATATPADDRWYDEPGQPLSPPAEDAFGSIGPEQKTRMFAMFGGLKMRDREAQVAFIEKATGVRVHSRNDLSYQQAARVLAALEDAGRPPSAGPAGDDPKTIRARQAALKGQGS